MRKAEKTNGMPVVLVRKLEETYAVIDQIDLEPIRKKVCKQHDQGGYNWPEKGAQEAVAGYRVFLKQLADYYYHNKTDLKPVNHIEAYIRNSTEGSMPPMVVDVIWHTHILCTEKYFKDCENIFGFYLHHQPDL